VSDDAAARGVGSARPQYSVESPDDLSYGPDGLLPVVVQDASTKEVLMLAYADAEAVRRTIATRTTWFWSRSRRAYWNKGASSGNIQTVVEIRYDCDADALLVLVDPAGPACHTGERSCFFRSLESNNQRRDLRRDLRRDRLDDRRE
jgi:phosphoribosyl-AMP cyclohydrolase